MTPETLGKQQPPWCLPCYRSLPYPKPPPCIILKCSLFTYTLFQCSITYSICAINLRNGVLTFWIALYFKLDARAVIPNATDHILRLRSEDRAKAYRAGVLLSTLRGRGTCSYRSTSNGWRSTEWQNVILEVELQTVTDEWFQKVEVDASSHSRQHWFTGTLVGVELISVLGQDMLLRPSPRHLASVNKLDRCWCATHPSETDHLKILIFWDWEGKCSLKLLCWYSASIRYALLKKSLKNVSVTSWKFYKPVYLCSWTCCKKIKMRIDKIGRCKAEVRLRITERVRTWKHCHKCYK